MDIKQILANPDPEIPPKPAQSIFFFFSSFFLSLSFLSISSYFRLYFIFLSPTSHFPANSSHDLIYCSGISHSKGPYSLSRTLVSIHPPTPKFPTHLLKTCDGEPFCIALKLYLLHRVFLSPCGVFTVAVGGGLQGSFSFLPPLPFSSQQSHLRMMPHLVPSATQH